MMTSVAAIFSNDRLNPVLIKELRQYFHNRFLVILMGLLLLGQLLLLLWVSTNQPDENPGMFTFMILWGAMGTVGVTVCAVGSLFRFLNERADAELDYTRITTLSPRQIIAGKLQAALLMLLFIGSLCLPFMVIAYFLRGVAMLAMMVLSGNLLLVLLIPIQLALAAGASGKRYMVAVFFVLLLSVLAYPLVGFLFLSMLAVTSQLFGRYDVMWMWGMGAAYFGLTALWLLLLLWSLALLKPPQSNKMWGIRLYLILMGLLFPLGLLLGFLCGGGNHLEYIIPVFGMLFAAGAITLMSCTVLFEPEVPGLRVLLQCPRGIWGRFGYFLFAAGYPGALLLSLLLLAAYWSCVWGMDQFGMDQDLIRIAVGAGGAVGYVPGYVMSALLCRRLLGKWPAWGYFLLIGLVLGVVPLFFDPAEIGLGWLSPFGYLDLYIKSQRQPTMWSTECNLVCLLLLFVALTPALYERFRAFRRPVMRAEEAAE